MGYDSAAVHAARMVAFAVKDLGGFKWGEIDSYDRATHSASVTLMPEGRHSGGKLQVGAPPGLCQPLPNRTLALVAVDTDGNPLCIVQTFYSAVSQPPLCALAVQGDAYVLGTLALLGGLTLGRTTVLPDPATLARGTTILLGVADDGVAGVADTVHVVIQDATGAHAWKTVTLT